MIASKPSGLTGAVPAGAHQPAWAIDIVQASALLGLAAHAYIWWRAYQHACAPLPEPWVQPGLLLAPFLLGLPVLLAAYRRKPWASLVLLGATFVGLVGGLTWLAGALRGEDVLSASNSLNAIDRSVFFLLPSLLAIPLTAACARLGLLSSFSSLGEEGDPKSLAS
jgi:hypothetical protein